MTACPSPQSLELLLADGLSAAEAGALETHIGGCGRCEALLKQLSDDPELRAWLEDGARTPPDSGTGTGLGRLLREPPARPRGMTEGLSFLGPPRREGDLGSLGPYLVEAELGRGGMGIVLRAHDEGLQRRVALKVLRPELAHTPARQRFVQEARAAARVRHDHVVTVYAVASPADGLPHFAMELLAEWSLAALIRARALGPQAAALFLAQAADGLTAAHAAGLVHRDVKPANILLEEVPGAQPGGWRAKVSDFGLAYRPEAQGSGERLTQEGALLGTPAYMSPEQAQGAAAVDARTDVYGLGAALYEALTGEVPFSGVPHLVLRQVLSEEPRPPRQLADVPRDLETICLKAMAKEPQRRYPSAAAFADDLRRWLRGEPIQARPAGRWEKTGRWCRRNPRVAWLGGMVLGLLVLLAVGSTVAVWLIAREQGRTAENLERALQAERQAKANLARAEENLKLARRSIDECYNVASEHPLFQLPRMEKAKKFLLEKTLPFYRDFRSQRPDDPGLRRAEAEQWARVGSIEHDLGRAAAACQAWEQARDLWAALVKAHPGAPDYADGLARTHHGLGGALLSLGKRPEALREYLEARDLRAPLVKAHPELSRLRNSLAETHDSLGVLLMNLGKRQAALREYRKALDLRAPLLEVHPGSVHYRYGQACTHQNLGLLLRGLGKRAEALAEYRQARALLRELARAHPEVPKYRQTLASTHHNLGALLLGGLDQRAEALREFEQARDLLRELARAHPDLPEYRHTLAGTHTNRGVLLRILGRRAEAVREHQQARDLLRELAEAHPERPHYRNELANAHNNLGAVLAELGKAEEARGEVQWACDLQSQLFQADPAGPGYRRQLATTHANLGELLGRLGKSPQALEHLDRARDLLRGAAEAQPDVSQTVEDLARVCLQRGQRLARMKRLKDSLPDLDECVRLADRLGRLAPLNSRALPLLGLGLSERAAVRTLLGSPHHAAADADWDRLLALTPAGRKGELCLQRVGYRARSGDYRRAAPEAEQLAGAPSVSSQALYTLAAAQALNAASAGRDATRSLTQREQFAERYARQAVALLRRAAATGLFGSAEGLQTLDSYEALAGLRDRADYRAFRAALKLGTP